MYASASWSAQHQRRGRAPAGMRLGHHVDDLVEGAADEVHELELGHGTHAGERRAKRRADNRRFGNGRIDHALRAEVMNETVSHFERAALNADAFADAEGGGVGLHLFPESLADCFEICCLCHVSPIGLLTRDLEHWTWSEAISTQPSALAPHSHGLKGEILRPDTV